jgi:hypothetical protein
MRIVLLILLTAVLSFSRGQSAGNSPVSENQQPIQLVFNQQEFGDKFSVLVTSDANYDYYAVDLTKLGERFERVYFMNLTYSDARLVNLDGDIQKAQTWFKSYYTYKEAEITCLFNDLKEKTDKALIAMTAEEKSEWLLKNDKFKK